MNIKEELARLERMTTGELAQRCVELCDEPIRTRNRAYVTRKIAWRLQALAEDPLSPGPGPYATAAACDMLAAREEALVCLRRQGVGVLECLPRSLTPQLVQRYLAMKTARWI